MKKFNTLKIITCSLTLVALMSATAFAAAGQPMVGAQGNSTPPAAGQEVKESAAKNRLVTGTVTDVAETKDSYSIQIGDNNDGVVFHAQPGVFVLDQKTGTYLTIKDIKKDMKVTAILNKLTPMTLSLPPQTSGAIGFVILSDGGSADLSVYDAQLVNFENSLKLNLNEKSKIVNVKGEKKTFTAADVKGSECLVLYGASTRSIPAQTSPDLVMIINTASQLTATDSPSDGDTTPDSDKAEVKYVALREGAAAKGYEVKWQGTAKPVLVTKDGISIELTINSTAFKFEHKTKDIQPLDKIEKLDLPVKFENGKTMVPSSFIEALS